MVLSPEASRMSSSNSLRRCWTQVQGTRLSVHGKHCKPGQDTGSAVTCCDSAQMYSSSTDEPAGGEEKETDNQFRLLPPPPPPVRIPSWMVGLVRGWRGRCGRRTWATTCCLPASMHSSNRGWPVQCHLLTLWKPLFGSCRADKAPF